MVYSINNVESISGKFRLFFPGSLYSNKLVSHFAYSSSSSSENEQDDEEADVNIEDTSSSESENEMGSDMEEDIEVDGVGKASDAESVTSESSDDDIGVNEADEDSSDEDGDEEEEEEGEEEEEEADIPNGAELKDKVKVGDNVNNPDDDISIQELEEIINESSHGNESNLGSDMVSGLHRFVSSSGAPFVSLPT